MLSEADALLSSNPLALSHYEILAAALMDAAHHDIEAGSNTAADSHLSKILDIPDQLPAAAGDPGSGLDLVLGQAALLLGDTLQAQQYLSDVNGDEKSKLPGSSVAGSSLCRSR